MNKYPVKHVNVVFYSSLVFFSMIQSNIADLVLVLVTFKLNIFYIHCTNHVKGFLGLVFLFFLSVSDISDIFTMTFKLKHYLHWLPQILHKVVLVEVSVTCSSCFLAFEQTHKQRVRDEFSACSDTFMCRCRDWRAVLF